MSPSVIPLSLAAVLYGAKDLRVEERTVWPPQAGQAQVSVQSTGLCGSDLHYYTHGRNGDFVLQAPMCLGHESAGIVTAVGPGVTTLRVGQRVAIECGVFCKKCSYCDEGRYNLCENMRFCSSAKTFPHLDGTLQGRINHPVELLHPLPDTCSFEQAALAEPLSVVLHATRRSGLKKYNSVLVFGAGAVGLLAASLARATGASRIVIVDVNQQRLDFAYKSGYADAIFNSGFGDRNASKDEALARSKELAKEISELSASKGGFDVVYECTGAEPCIQMGIYAARTGGKVMLVGMGSPSPNIPLSAAAFREVDLLGVFRYANTYPAALALLGSGALNGVEKMITHRFSLEDSVKAFEMVARGVDDDGRLVVKVMVGPNYS